MLNQIGSISQFFTNFYTPPKGSQAKKAPHAQLNGEHITRLTSFQRGKHVKMASKPQPNRKQIARTKFYQDSFRVNGTYWPGKYGASTFYTLLNA